MSSSGAGLAGLFPGGAVGFVLGNSIVSSSSITAGFFAAGFTGAAAFAGAGANTAAHAGHFTFFPGVRGFDDLSTLPHSGHEN